MRTTSILTATAIALAATIGSASAADRFTTLAGFDAQALTEQEMGEVRGSASLTILILGGSSTVPLLGVLDEQQVPDQSLTGLIKNPFNTSVSDPGCLIWVIAGGTVSPFSELGI